MTGVKPLAVPTLSPGLKYFSSGLGSSKVRIEPAPTAVPAMVTPEQALAELQAPITPPLEVNAFAPVEQTLEFDFSEPSQMDKLLNAVKESNSVKSNCFILNC